MNKNPLQRKHILTQENNWYQKIATNFWKMQLSWDGEDITSKLSFEKKEKKAIAKIITKSEGILAGREECEFFLKQENIAFSFFKTDGEKVNTKDLILELEDDIQKLLKAERIILNVLSRMSGIATQTQDAVKKIPKNILLCPTRKTLWGPIDKKAVAIGGGGTHRLGLFDAILIKENHLIGQNNTTERPSLLEISKKIDLSKNTGAFWEIEIETEEEFFFLFKNLPKKRPGVIMFDNFFPKNISAILKKIQKPEGIFLEASGGITPENISEFGISGIDIISAGFLTNTAPIVDYSMRIE